MARADLTEDVQGNILGGFAKDAQVLLFLRIIDAARFKCWLREAISQVTTAADIVRGRRMATTGRSWPDDRACMNIAFTHPGLCRLTDDAGAFGESAFREGLAARSAALGDPLDPSSEGHPTRWLFGGLHTQADVVLLFAATDMTIVARDVARVRMQMSDSPAPCAHVTFEQACRKLGHGGACAEHFAFLDPISQPRLDGVDSSLGDDEMDSAGFVQPSTPLSDVLLGVGDDPAATVMASGMPPWAVAGSFLVLRRLRQDVCAFHTFVKQAAQHYDLRPGDVAARMVGRWPNGAPLVRTPLEERADDAQPATRNAFCYYGDADSGYRREHADPRGEACPISAHIRKMNPRDIQSRSGNTFPNVRDSLSHRMLRRSLPFGSPSASTPDRPLDDGVDRGLLFMSYQASIERQFEFVVKRWANEPNFPEPLAGHDPIIGQNNRHLLRRRTFLIGPDMPLTTDREWVQPTGGAYCFVPSLTGLRRLSR